MPKKNKNIPRFQAMFIQFRQNNVFFHYLSKLLRIFNTNYQSYSIYHLFKPNIFRDVQKLSQEKASMDRTINEFILLTSFCWNRKFQPLTIQMTKVICTGRYRLRFNGFFNPNGFRFQIIKRVFILM